MQAFTAWLSSVAHPIFKLLRKVCFKKLYPVWFALGNLTFFHNSLLDFMHFCFYATTISYDELEFVAAKRTALDPSWYSDQTLRLN